MAPKLPGMVLALLLIVSCGEKPQEPGPSGQMADVQSRGTGDPMRSRTHHQDESARIYH